MSHEEQLEGAKSGGLDETLQVALARQTIRGLGREPTHEEMAAVFSWALACLREGGIRMHILAGVVAERFPIAVVFDRELDRWLVLPSIPPHLAEALD